MDPRNYKFGIWIDPDRGVRTSSVSNLRPVPSFYRAVEQRWWNPSDGIPAGVTFRDENPVGTSLDSISSYHPVDDCYYGRKGTQLARQPASLLGQENTIEVASGSVGVAYSFTRVDRDDDTPRYVYLHGSKMWYTEGEFDSLATPVQTLDFNDYGGAEPATNLSQLDTDGYGRVWVTQYQAAGQNTPHHVFMSADFGQTWKLVFDMKDHFDSPKHVHAVVYDPFDDWVFVLTGDVEMGQVFVSYDNGENWFRMFEDGAVQFTECMVFPDHIALASDRVSLKGVLIVDREMIRHRVFKGQKLDLHEVYVQALWETPGTQTPFFTRSNQTTTKHTGWGVPDVTVVGVAPTSSATPGYLSPLYITRDGYRWHEIWRTTNPARTIHAVHGPDSNGHVVCMGGSMNLAFKIPEWK